MALNDMLADIEVQLLDEESLQEYYSIFEKTYEMIVKNSEQNQIPTQLRDTLLPKLMNGEIDLGKMKI